MHARAFGMVRIGEEVTFRTAIRAVMGLVATFLTDRTTFPSSTSPARPWANPPIVDVRTNWMHAIYGVCCRRGQAADRARETSHVPRVASTGLARWFRGPGRAAQGNGPGRAWLPLSVRGRRDHVGEVMWLYPWWTFMTSSRSFRKTMSSHGMPPLPASDVARAEGMASSSLGGDTL